MRVMEGILELKISWYQVVCNSCSDVSGTTIDMYDTTSTRHTDLPVSQGAHSISGQSSWQGLSGMEVATEVIHTCL